MKRKNMNKLLALAMAGVMTLGNGIVVFAEDGVTGNGVVEYDNSEAVAYDIVEVPTVAASTYNFTLDPTGQLHTFQPAQYDEGTVYFSSIGTRASVEGKTGVTLYTQSKSAVAATNGVWGSIVTVTDGAISAVAPGYFVWVPDTADEAYDAGKPGKFVELTTSNIGNWFELKGDAADANIGLKDDYKADPNVCDGKIYQNTYTAVTGNKITDSDTDPLGNYVTITDDAPTAFPNLYTSNTGTAATAADVEYTAAEVVNQGRTDAVTVINKSTNAKTVTATVTMSNTTGITFNNSATYANDDDDASMYVTATNGTTTNALVAAADGASATATYTVDLAAPTIGEITYMAAGTNSATGGHNYARYEANGTTYGSDSFYITATANSNAAAKDAWNEWAAGVTSTTRPKINIIYTVADKVTAPSVTETSVSGENNVIHYSAPAGVSVDKVELVYSEGTQTLVLTADEHYTIDTGAKTITIVSAVLSNNVHASNKIKVYFNDTSTTIKELSIVADE